MKLGIVEKPYGFETLYGDQIVGVIRRETLAGWIYRPWVQSWDHFNPKEVQRLKSMVDDKIKLLNLTDRLTK